MLMFVVEGMILIVSFHLRKQCFITYNMTTIIFLFLHLYYIFRSCVFLGKYKVTLYTVHSFNYKLRCNCCYIIDASYNGKYNFGKRGLC